VFVLPTICRIFTFPELSVNKSLGPFSDTDNPDAASDACNLVLQKSLLGDGEFGGARGWSPLVCWVWGPLAKPKDDGAGHQDKPMEYRLARMILSGLGYACLLIRESMSWVGTYTGISILDIDKLIEYRNPQFPSQCGDPQRKQHR
jgi:hypothetical protein